MTERLTRKIGYEYEKAKRETQLLEINNKLGKLEDILEKYSIESVEELEKEMHSLMLIISILNDYGIEDYNELDEILKEFSYMKKMETEIGKELKFYKTDRDTWQKACELACREAPLHCPNPPEYYNAQDEYGSDEPYYIQESACEFSDDVGRCRECQMDYFYQQAKKGMEY